MQPESPGMPGLRSKSLIPIAACALLAIAMLAGCSRAEERRTITIFAAASLVNAIPEAVDSVARNLSEDIRIVYNFAGSSTLARQISAGSPAALFISANPDWIQTLVRRKQLRPDSVFLLLNNKLAVVVPAGADFQVPSLDALRSDTIRYIALGDPSHVPAGLYAREALQRAGLWQELREKLVTAQDVRAALAFVETGEAQAGIVYSTDAGISRRVRTAFVLPDSLQPEIRYHIAVLPNAPQAAHELLRLLQQPAAGAVFEKYGFTVPTR